MKRTVLPQRRAHHRIELMINNHFFTCGFHIDENNRLLEVFIDAKQASSQLHDAARDIAILTSLALQHGASVDTIRKALTRLPDGLPTGIGGAVLDAIYKEYGVI